ncbi:Clp protease ClpP, partial [Bacillus pacificus]|nr:Clp protease ClpP [Bacillus pacificus]
GFRNGTINKGQGITKEDLNAALSGLKNEILNDLQNNKEEQPKEPNPKPVKNSGIKGLLLKL